MIGIIDYGAGNLLSVKNALNYLGFESKYIRSADEFDSIEKLILPGVGSFGYCMTNIRQQDLEEPILEYIKLGKPFLGICIGMQLLFEKSEESPGIDGMAVFEGKVRQFTKGKVPQIGWNNIQPTSDCNLEPGYTYFVNSYYADPDDEEIVCATANYHIDFPAAVGKDNVFATQFHPEKSGDVGMNFLRSWLNAD